jgi:hypothetical protein
MLDILPHGYGQPGVSLGQASIRLRRAAALNLRSLPGKGLARHDGA